MSFLPDDAVARLRAAAGRPDLSGSKYRLEGPLGSGGMGSVWRVKDVELGREAALKVLDVPDPGGDLSRRLTAEARLLAALEHPNIVPVHDVGVLPDGRVFYVMKLVEGRRLDEWRRDAPSRSAMLRLFQKVCGAVAFAHARGVLHRDLKPENVMVGAFGEALVMDWGVAKILRERPVESGHAGAGADPGPGASAIVTEGPASPGATAPGTVIGTPAWMAPEQARGDVGRLDERADVYSLGAILYYLLAGRPPYEGATRAEVLRRAAEAAPASLRQIDPGIPRALQAICVKAMAAEPARRYASAEEMSADLDRFLDGLPVLAHRETVIEKGARVLGRHRTLAYLVLAYLMMRVMLLVLMGG